MKVGIDAISYYLPQLFLPIRDLAIARNIEPEKLEFGLGLKGMSFPDSNEDVVSMALNAVFNLISENKLQINEISRIYVGTESNLDSSKPIGSYILSELEKQFGNGSMEHCDTVDFTFACIGGVDALHNCIDFIRLNPNKKAIVVTTDFAKYDLNSSGEYTQGAGALSLLVTSNPSILSISTKIGISTSGVFDFFKPRRYFEKETILKEDASEIISESEISVYKEQPVFDGHYSNECYISRIKNAYINFCIENNLKPTHYTKWKQIYMHLPYCYQGRRTFIEIIAETQPELLSKQNGETEKEKIKTLSKSTYYKKFIEQKLVPSEKASGNVGNLYTGSLFLGMLSALNHAFQENINLTNKKVGFIAYGSGSKSKVFEGKIEANWKTKIENSKLFEFLNKRDKISFETYEKLYKKDVKSPILVKKDVFVLDYIEKTKETLLGARFYKKN